MRVSHSNWVTALFFVIVLLASAGAQGTHNRELFSSPRVSISNLPPPPPSHGHGQETNPGTSPCGYSLMVSANCAGTATSKTQPTGTRGNGPGNRGDGGGPPGRTQPVRTPVPPIGYGVGLFSGIPIWRLNEYDAQQANERLSREGPQLPEALRMSDFRVTGLARGSWPVVVDYAADPGSYVVLTVVTQNAPPAQATLAAPSTGRRLQLLRLPAEFGTTLKSAAFSIDATASATDSTPRYVRIYGFGCGPRAVGSVAIDQLRFGPQAVSASQPETHFGFHTHTTFDKMKAEFMQVTFVDNSIEGKLFDKKKIDRRVAEGESVNDEWSATRAQAGQIQFRVRGWMTVRGDQGGDWVSAFSPDLVFKQ